MKRDASQSGKEASRRRFLKLGACSLGAGALGGFVDETQAENRVAHTNPKTLRNDPDAQVVHSVCLACNSRCGVRGVVKDGVLVGVEGNPYHPYATRLSPLPMSAPVLEALGAQASVCGKALNTPMQTYNPRRIVRPLKRSGPRGSGRFEPIAWETLVRELVEGGKLFAHLGEERSTPGFRDVLVDDPIDPTDHTLGPKRNGLVLISGRLQSGRQEFIDRFIKDACGSPNHIQHTDICGLGFRMGNFAMTNGKEVELKADPRHVECLLVIGANIYEALQPGVNTYAAVIGERSGKGGPRLFIVDPRATAASVHAELWLPIKPGMDGAFALAVARRLLETGKCNQRFLSSPTKEAAAKKGFGSATNAAHLVIDAPGDPLDGKMLRFKHIDPSRDEKSGEIPMVIDPASGRIVPADSLDTAMLEGAGRAVSYFGKTYAVRTAFTLYKEQVFAFGFNEYCDLCGLSPVDVAKTADAFAEHGARSAVTQYHGAGNYVGGLHAAFAVATLNLLVGSVDMKGGFLKSGGGVGNPMKGLYELADFPGKRTPAGPTISREKAAYEKSAEFKRKKSGGGSGYPAKRPWFPFTRGGLSNEAMNGIGEGYPYPCSILITYLYNGVYSAPGGGAFRPTLTDHHKTPLHISLDVAVNETNLYADYIIPELTYPEGHYGWLTPHAPGQRFTGFRTPMIDPLTEKTADGRPICTETLFIDLALAMQLPGFGAGVIASAAGDRLPLKRAEDFYLRAFANVVDAAKIAGSQADLDYVASNHPHRGGLDVLPESQRMATASAIARGGVFHDGESLFDGERFTRGLPLYLFYNEQLGTVRNSISGRKCPGSPAFVQDGFADGRLIDAVDAEYPFTVISYKSRLHTQSRSMWYSLSLEIMPENFVEMHPEDAAALNLLDGERVRLESAEHSAGSVGVLRLTRLVRRGVIAVSFHYGHTQFGASPLMVKDAASVFLGGTDVVDKEGLIAEPRFRAGINPNDLGRCDSSLGGAPLMDTWSGIPDFSSTRVRIVKV